MGAHFAHEWLREDSRTAFEAARARATEGERPRVAVGLLDAVIPVDMVLELVRLAGPPRPLVMGVMVDAVAQGTAQPLSPAQGALYEVQRSAGGPWRVLRHLTPDGEVLADGGAVPCYRRGFGRSTECPQCPVRPLKGAAKATAVLRDEGEPFRVHVVTARARGEDAATVTAIPVDGGAYGALVQARIDYLAQVAKLTTREGELLRLLLLGRSLADVATVVGITPRTAKYHQQNLLRKLGADSRVDLFRLLL